MSKKAEIVVSAKDKSKQAFDSIARSLKSMAVLSTAAGVATAASFLNVARETAKLNDETIKASRALGITAEQLSSMRYAADLSGVSFEQLQTGIRKISQNTYEASTGMKTYAEDFDRLGINIRESNGTLKDADTLINEVADRFADMQDGTEKTALAVSLFGRSGAQMINMLNGGSEGLREMREEAAQLGLVIDTETARASEQFNDNLTRLEARFSALKISIGNDALPYLADLAEYFVQASTDGLDLIEVLGGIGFAVDRAFNGSSFEQRADRIQELSQFIAHQSKELANAGEGSNPAVMDRLKQKIEAAKAEMKTLVKLQSELFAKQNAPKPTLDAGGNKPTLGNTGGGTSKVDADARAAANFVEQLKKQADTLGLSQGQLVAYDAAHLKLSESQRRSVEASIASIEGFEAQQKAAEKAKAEIEEMDRLLQASDARELANIEEASAKEAERLAAQSQAYEDLFNQLAKQNEDLNVELIKDDTARAEAQLALEHQRVQDRISLLMFEGEEAARLSEMATENYQKELEKLKNATDKAKDSASDFGFTFNSELEDIAINGGKAGDVIDALFADIQRMALRKTVTDPLGDLISGAIGSFDFGSFFGGGRASGGPVSRGRFYEVNEDMPELLTVGNRSFLMMGANDGDVTPASQSRSGVGVASSSVVVNVYNQGGNTEAEVQERDDGGVRIIDVLIKEVSNAQAAQMSAGKGALYHSVKNRFGLNPVAGATF